MFRLALGIAAFLLLVRRIRIWRETRQPADLLRLWLLSATLLLLVTWHVAATVMVAVLVAVFWLQRGISASQRTKRQATDETLRGVTTRLRTISAESPLANVLEAEGQARDLARLNSNELAERLDDPNPVLRRRIVAQLIHRRDRIAWDALAAQLGAETDGNVQGDIAVALAKTGRAVGARHWLSVLRHDKTEVALKTHAMSELWRLDARHAQECMFDVADAALQDSLDKAAPLVLEVTHAALAWSLHDQLRERTSSKWICAYADAAETRLHDSALPNAADTVAAVSTFHALLAQGELAHERAGAQRLDWLLQPIALAKALPDYTQEVGTEQQLVASSSTKVRFRLEQQLSWSCIPSGSGSLDLVPGWYDALLSFDFVERAQDGMATDVLKLCLQLHAGGGEYEIEAMWPAHVLFDQGSKPDTVRTFLARSPEAWLSALWTRLQVRNVHALLDSREHVELTIEDQAISARLKYQGLLHDLSLIGGGELEGDGQSETTLLVVVRGLLARMPALDEEAIEVPPFAYLLRFESLLRDLEPIELSHQEEELANPIVRARPL